MPQTFARQGFFTGVDVPMKMERMIDSVKVAGIIAITYGAFCWYLLPNTVPKAKARSLALWSTFRIYGQRSMAILLISADLREVLHLSDRLGVLYEGQFTGVFDDVGALTESEVGEFMLGARRQEAEHS